MEKLMAQLANLEGKMGQEQARQRRVSHDWPHFKPVCVCVCEREGGEREREREWIGLDWMVIVYEQEKEWIGLDGLLYMSKSVCVCVCERERERERDREIGLDCLL